MSKKNLLTIAALITLAACQDKVAIETATPSEDTVEYPVPMTFYGINDTYSRTVLNNESILWESGDAIRVLWGENSSNKSVAQTFNNGVNAEFPTTVEYASDYYGVHPYSAASSLKSGVLKVTVPAVQTGVFADANIAVAKADAQRNMFFRHAVSFLEFTTDRTGTLEFTAGASAPLAGDVTVRKFDTEGRPVLETAGTASFITLDIKSSGTYYIALLPYAKLDMLSFTLSDNGTDKYIVSTNSIQMAPGKLVGLGNISDRFKETRPVGATLESFRLEEFQFDW